MFGTKRKMESKVFKGAVWKQYYAALEYINNNFLNELVIRVDGSADTAYRHRRDHVIRRL